MTPSPISQGTVTWTLQFWPVLVVSVTTSLLATVCLRKLAMHLGIVDTPDDRVKTHKEPVAYLGGVALLCGIFAGAIAGIFCGPDGLSQMHLYWLTMCMAGALVTCAVGVTDDLKDLLPRYKLLGQILAATLLVLAGIRPQVQWFGASVPQGVQLVLNTMLVYVFVMGASNSLNLLDGLDGLCAGVTGIMTVGLLLLGILWTTWSAGDTGNPLRLILCVALLGSVLGFLPFNRHPARIFMGDAGSLLLGFCVAVIMILFAESAHGCLVSVMIFGLPVLDTTVAVVRRCLNGRPLFESDRGHVYDQIMDRGLYMKKTVALCYGLSSIYVLIGLIMSQMRLTHSLLLGGLVIVMSGLTVWHMGFLRMKGLRGAIQK
ncbi:MAG: undecaprenyl/decaprenyl-phosphate alpha-N-acetylglucosaminyl 1-phosphate transferase [Phycisphaerae bacterium]|nr:undecaprenyl/decaprenyl-phosphate alpha-N-acetylglucosaminyl 1-phosphate transferase [Phycisphaerae bacterium]